MRVGALLSIAAIWVAAVTTSAAADCVAQAPAQLSVNARPGATSPDQAGRAIAAVYVNDQGPFRFVVDTGANRSVLSARLADQLGLISFGAGEVHSVTDMQMAPLAHVRSLRFGPVDLANTALPVIDGPMLAGEQGMLGFDGMSGRRLEMDFVHHCVEILDAATAPPLSNWVMVQGQLRFSSMMVARGEIEGVRVNVLIDTGSDVSLCNHAFRTALERVRAIVVEYHGGRAYTAGRPLFFDDSIWAPRIHVGHTMISNVTAYEGDYHIFRLWNLQDKPTVLVGMDVIGPSGAMAIDYTNSQIYFRRAPRARPGSEPFTR
ncbi:MAG: retropepsin-like aspartic protease [Pseudomonadota bacterium]